MTTHGVPALKDGVVSNVVKVRTPSAVSTHQVVCLSAQDLRTAHAVQSGQEGDVSYVSQNHMTADHWCISCEHHYSSM